MGPAEIITRPAPPDAAIRYGPGPYRIADLRLPGGCGPRGVRRESRPFVVLLHGGFWRVAFDRLHVS
jgi:hypothetical protein